MGAASLNHPMVFYETFVIFIAKIVKSWKSVGVLYLTVAKKVNLLSEIALIKLFEANMTSKSNKILIR